MAMNPETTEYVQAIERPVHMTPAVMAATIRTFALDVTTMQAQATAWLRELGEAEAAGEPHPEVAGRFTNCGQGLRALRDHLTALHDLVNRTRVNVRDVETWQGALVAAYRAAVDALPPISEPPAVV